MNKISGEEFKELKRNHYELWDWLSKNPDKSKEDWFTLENNYFKSAHVNCFACEFTLLTTGSESSKCNYCPLCENSSDDCLDGLYSKWYFSCSNPTARSEYARQIRDLKWDKNNCLDYVEKTETSGGMI